MRFVYLSYTYESWYGERVPRDRPTFAEIQIGFCTPLYHLVHPDYSQTFIIDLAHTHTWLSSLKAGNERSRPFRFLVNQNIVVSEREKQQWNWSKSHLYRQKSSSWNSSEIRSQKKHRTTFICRVLYVFFRWFPRSWLSYHSTVYSAVNAMLAMLQFAFNVLLCRKSAWWF